MGRNTSTTRKRPASDRRSMSVESPWATNFLTNESSLELRVENASAGNDAHAQVGGLVDPLAIDPE
jgi:hypothetical protein